MVPRVSFLIVGVVVVRVVTAARPRDGGGGTRTTGVGSAGGRHRFGGRRAGRRRSRVVVGSDEVLLRAERHSVVDDADADDDEDDNAIYNHNNGANVVNADSDDNPMRGKLWVRRRWSREEMSSSLMFKLKLVDGGATYIELYESSSSSSRNGEENDMESDNDGIICRDSNNRGNWRGALRARYCSDKDDDDGGGGGDDDYGRTDCNNNNKRQKQQSSSSVTTVTSSLYVPIEGIYGVYHLPHTGPHIVLITESEAVYKSPTASTTTTTTTTTTSISTTLTRCRKDVPLFELRRIKSLEIIAMRNNSNDDNGQQRRRRRIGRSATESLEQDEEARQLRLLRRSFREHDLYFTVPRQYYPNDCQISAIDNNSNTEEEEEIVIIPDVTHTLQRTFMELYPSASKRRPFPNQWWRQYIHTNEIDQQQQQQQQLQQDAHGYGHRTSGGNDDDMTCKESAVVVDRRFFWNELPALSLLPPSSVVLPSVTSVLPSNHHPASPYFRLLDYVIPVTSAFVGVQLGVTIPSSSVSSSSSSSSITNGNNNSINHSNTQKERYDQLLISRRSKFRAGTRFTRRGVDNDGNVANYAETEQICFIMSNDNNNNNNNNTNINECNISTPNNLHNDNNHHDKDSALEVYSHVQTRGSIPLHWSSPVFNVMTYRPRVYIGVDPLAQARGLRDHLWGELRRYSTTTDSSSIEMSSEKKNKAKIAMVNLIDKHSDQGRLGNAFDSVLNAVLDVYKDSKIFSTSVLPLRPNSIEHIWFDFHDECKGGRYDRLSHLLDQVMPTLNDQGYFCAVLPPSMSQSSRTNGTTYYPHTYWEIQSWQDGVVRTNCMDCLDRTNVVQSLLGRYMLHKIIHERIGRRHLSVSNRTRRTLPLEHVVAYKRRPLILPWIEGEESHRHLWADNADAISKLYAGTAALKGDFTRTGKRTKRGAIDDGVNSLQRYYVNNFIDADRQEGMDLLVGDAEFNNDVIASTSSSSSSLLSSDDKDEIPVNNDHLRLISRRRRGYDESHARIKINSGESFGGRLIKSLGNKDKVLQLYHGGSRHHTKGFIVNEDDNISAPTSAADLLLAVTSVASPGEDIQPLLKDAALNNLPRSFIKRKIGEVLSWWVPSNSERLPKEKSYTMQGWNVSGFSSMLAVIVYFIILLRAPILSAAFLVAAIAFGLSTS